MAQLWAMGWRRGDTSDNVPTHSAFLSLLAKSSMCHTPSEAWGGHCGFTLCQHLWEHFISTHQTIRQDWSEFSTGTLSRVSFNTSETSNTKLLAAVTFIWQMQPFLLIILRAVVFLVISFRIKSAEAYGTIFKQELPKEQPQPLLAKSNCRAHWGQGIASRSQNLHQRKDLGSAKPSLHSLVCMHSTTFSIKFLLRIGGFCIINVYWWQQKSQSAKFLS